MKILLKVKFDGTGFCGYQAQPKKRTVQTTLNEAALKLTGKPCCITGCSRTDSGVHALSFYCTVTCADESEISIPLANIPGAFNSLLPNDISVVGAFYVPDTFHARYDVINKEYTYLLYNSQHKDPFLANRALQLFKLIDNQALCRMSYAAEQLCGKHDFKSFMAQNSGVCDTQRTIYYAKFEREEQLIKFKICGNGFLYNMVRIIVGTILDVGYKRTEPSDILEIIKSKDRKNAGQTVPAHGLYLSSVRYADEFGIN